MNNYPDGAANDPGAPWNEKESKTVKCDECSGDGNFKEDGETYKCDWCNGTGECELV